MRRFFFKWYGVVPRCSYSEHVLVFMVMYLKSTAVNQEYLCLLRNTYHYLETPLAVSEYEHWVTVVLDQSFSLRDNFALRGHYWDFLITTLWF